MNIVVEKDFDWRPLAKMYHLTVEILLDGKIMLTAGYVKGVDVVGSLLEFVSICNNWEPEAAVCTISYAGIALLKNDFLDSPTITRGGIIETVL